MSPGLPGIGLGALFCILSALAAPLVELARTASGQSGVANWGRVGRQFALAVAIIAAFDVTLWLVYALVAGIGFPELTPGGALALPSVLIGMSVGLRALLAGAKGMELAVPIRSGHLPPVPVRAKLLPRRLLLQGAGVLVAAWFPLLGFGAAGLSTLSDGVVSRPGPAVERGAGADVAGAVSARKRSVDATGDEPVPEASVAPLADGSDGSSPASSSDGEGGCRWAPHRCLEPNWSNRRPSRRRLKATPAGPVGSPGRAGWPYPTPAATVGSRRRAGRRPLQVADRRLEPQRELHVLGHHLRGAARRRADLRPSTATTELRGVSSSAALDHE